jgi:glycosyltransferase involved in cell wall biosynthesis
MKILMATQYYSPYKSGLSEYVRLLAEGLVLRGHEVRVMAGRHRDDLPGFERLQGVVVERLPVAMYLHRAAVMPGYIPMFLRIIKEVDLVNIHLPIPECWPLFRFAGNRKSVATFHCSIDLGKSFVWQTLERLYSFCLIRSLRHATKIVVNAKEYFDSLKIPVTAGRIVEIHPPAKELAYHPRGASKRQFGVERCPTVGFLGRPVAEKGITYLVKACGILGQRFPNLSVLIAGNLSAAGPVTTGELENEIEKIGNVRFRLLGQVKEEDLGSFYAACDVLVLPSINAMESFGMVQIEAMLCGTPVVASDLPGVRLPVRKTGMGLLSAPGNPVSIARGISSVLMNRRVYLRPRDQVLRVFGLEQSILKYEGLFKEVMESEMTKASGI